MMTVKLYRGGEGGAHKSWHMWGSTWIGKSAVRKDVFRDNALTSAPYPVGGCHFSGSDTEFGEGGG